MGGWGRREKSDESNLAGWFELHYSYYPAAVYSDFSNIASHKKYPYMACWRGTGKQ